MDYGLKQNFDDRKIFERGVGGGREGGREGERERERESCFRADRKFCLGNSTRSIFARRTINMPGRRRTGGEEEEEEER